MNDLKRGVRTVDAQKECPAEKSGAKSVPYRTYEFNEYGNRHSVTVSFEMAYHDWLKLENSEPFQRLVDYLVKLQTTDDRHES